MKNYDNDIGSNDTWEYSSHAIGYPVTMFSLYVSIFFGKKDEQQITNHMYCCLYYLQHSAVIIN